MGPPGRISLPPARTNAHVYILSQVTAAKVFRTRLLLGAGQPVQAWLNGAKVYDSQPATGQAAPDQAGSEVTLRQGENRLLFRITYRGDREGLYVRLLDPERRLGYAEGKGK